MRRKPKGLKGVDKCIAYGSVQVVIEKRWFNFLNNVHSDMKYVLTGYINPTSFRAGRDDLNQGSRRSLCEGCGLRP